MNSFPIIFRAGISAALALVTSNAYSFDDTAYADVFSNDWGNPTLSFNDSYQNNEGDFHTLIQRYTKKRDRSRYVIQYDEIVSSFTSSETEFGGLHFGGQFSDLEQHTSAGITIGRATFFTNVGHGEDFSKVSSMYAGMDPYAYHGGRLSDFSYSGSGLNLSLGGGKQFQVGYSEVRSDGLENRRSSYVDFSTQRFFGRYTHIERGGVSIAYGLDAGFRHGRVDVSYQSLTSERDVDTRRVRFNFIKDKRDRFWLDLSQHRNAVFSGHNDAQIMVSWQRQLGKKTSSTSSRLSNGFAQGSNPQAEGRNAFLRAASIGAGAASAALITSSGDAGQDGITLRRATGHDAAREVVNYINPTSVELNVEFGGYIYRLPDGSFFYTAPLIGDANSVIYLPQFVIVPPGAEGTAHYHTHAAADPRFLNEQFSPTDINTAESSGLDSYLGTPAGRFVYYDPNTNQVSELGPAGTIAN